MDQVALPGMGGVTQVVNRRGRGFRWLPGDVDISRAGPFGNPFVIDRDGDRAMVIAAFEAYARTRGATDRAWREQVKGLVGKRLVCWCKPLPCHGDVLQRLAEEWTLEDARRQEEEERARRKQDERELRKADREAERESDRNWREIGVVQIWTVNPSLDNCAGCEFLTRIGPLPIDVGPYPPLHFMCGCVRVEVDIRSLRPEDKLKIAQWAERNRRAEEEITRQATELAGRRDLIETRDWRKKRRR